MLSLERSQQETLFGTVKTPISLSCGVGVNSVAMIIELNKRGFCPDFVLFADTGAERPQTYAYLPVLENYLERIKWPRLSIVKAETKTFKNLPYATLAENMISNSTLPSASFGFSSCSQRWKQAPMKSFLKEKGQEAIAAGLKIKTLIGFDAGKRDMTRFHKANKLADDPQFDPQYPLVHWGMDREACIDSIKSVDLEVPVKSSCFCCIAMKPDEVRTLRQKELVQIILMEARAEPRLEKIDGIWRSATKGTRGGEKRPGKMTDFIREEALLDPDFIDYVISDGLCQLGEAHETGMIDWLDFLERYSEEDALPMV